MVPYARFPAMMVMVAGRSNSNRSASPASPSLCDPSWLVRLDGRVVGPLLWGLAMFDPHGLVRLDSRLLGEFVALWRKVEFAGRL